MHGHVRSRLAARLRQGTVPKTVPGVMGKLLPAYTYHGDPAGVVLCDNVDGWFAFRA